MKVLDLRCRYEHAFEGWFGSEEDFQQQLQRGLVQCPVCGEADVRKTLSVPRLNLNHSQSNKPKASSVPKIDSATSIATPSAAAPIEPAAQEMLHRLHGAWVKAAREIVEKTEDVGPRFAQEARKMHYGDAPERGIRGQASPKEAAELADEGIEIIALPLPPGVGETLQ